MGFAVRDLTKSYAGVTVLDSVDLSVADGEIHALLGANGAGKTTLIKCVSGAVTPDSGEIKISDRTYSALTPKEAQRAGVAVVHQEPSVASTLSVADNLFLGHELRSGPFLLRGRQRAEARRWLEQLGVDLDPHLSLSSLGNAELQVVEILKALCRKPKVLILDEPTAALTEAEALGLKEQMRTLKEHGLPLLYVTHRLGEVFEVADRVTVLRGGKVVLSAEVANITYDDVVASIAGRDLVGGRGGARPEEAAQAEPVLRLDSIVAHGIGPLDLEVYPGEIVGVYGLVGSGRTELVETLFGARRMHGGTIEFKGKDLKLRHPSDAVAAGIALVPSDRLRKSIFPTLGALENILLPSFGRLSLFGVRRRLREKQTFDAGAGALNLEPRRPRLEARRFSGGNQQKLVIGRWLQAENGSCELLLLDEPTQGVDVGARSELYEALRRFVERGDHAVVVTSSEPEELIALADRVVVLSRGRKAGLLASGEIDERRLLELAHLGE